MSLTPSTMLPLGTQAPDFQLPDTEGNTVTRDQFKGSKGLLVMFICNHCPYVKHLRSALADLGREYQDKGIAMVAISANDSEKYPADSPEKMKEEAKSAGYPFPYVFDESQSVAKAYRAACTPDFFLFNGNFELVYRGQFDDSRPGNDTPITGKDLKGAMNALLEGKPAAEKQVPSMGCNIKWKPGNEPDYFG